MGAPASPLLGKRFGCFIVTERVSPPPDGRRSHDRSHWRVRCECGFTKVVMGQNLQRFFPVKCNHVPPGHRVIGPAEVAVLKACAGAENELNMAAQRYPELIPLIEALGMRSA